jgi:translation elongation factor EF-Tu-like GTPase
MMASPSSLYFHATLRLLRTEEGGRKTPFIAGGTRYRPDFQLVGGGPAGTCFVHSVAAGESESMQPGDEREVQIELLNPEKFERLKSGAAFTLREGPKVVARGTITKILGPSP